ncbi:MAG: hypothetical protein ACFFD4_17845 [Candidatus Odinarchaeota archaeon]
MKERDKIRKELQRYKKLNAWDVRAYIILLALSLMYLFFIRLSVIVAIGFLVYVSAKVIIIVLEHFELEELFVTTNTRSKPDDPEDSIPVHGSTTALPLTVDLLAYLSTCIVTGFYWWLYASANVLKFVLSLNLGYTSTVLFEIAILGGFLLVDPFLCLFRKALLVAKIILSYWMYPDEQERFRGIIYLLIFTVLFLLFFFFSVSPRNFDLSAITMVGMIIVVPVCGFLLNAISFIFTGFIIESLMDFDIYIGIDKKIASLPIISHMTAIITSIVKWFGSAPIIRSLLQNRFTKKLKGISASILANKTIFLILTFIFPIEILPYLTGSKSVEEMPVSVILPFIQRAGFMLVFISFLLAVWLILRYEDITKAIERMEGVLKGKKRFRCQIKTNNPKFEKAITWILEKSHKSADEEDLKSVTVMKFQKYLDGIDGFLVGALPVMVFGILVYYLGILLANFSMFIEEELTDLFPAILFIMSIYAAIILIIYQSGRRNMVRRFKHILKEMNDESCIDLAKELDFYLDKPDIITTTIIIALPLLSMVIRILPQLLEFIQKAN